MRVRNQLCLACSASALIWVQPAFAQASDPIASQPENNPDIIVTASRREERLIEAPQSVTAVTSDDLSRLNALEFRDFANTIPALTFTTQGAGQTQVTLRGVTTGNDIGPTVGIYVDDVPYGSSSAFSNAASLALDVGLFDLDRIEVLRGPQGTLYGTSTMGGLLKYVTTPPDPGAFGGNAKAGLSSTGHGGINYDGSAAINVPIVSGKLALRAGGFYSRDGGYVDNVALHENDVDRSRIYGGKLDLLLQASDALTVRLTGFLQDIDRDGTPAADYMLDGRPVDGALDQRRLFTEPFNERFRLVSGTVNYDFGGATLTSITSYQTLNVRFREDASAVYVPVLAGLGIDFSKVAIDQGRVTDKFTQEVRLASATGHPIEWLIGGFYTHEKSGNSQQSEQYDLTGSPSPLSLAAVQIPSLYEEIAGFGNVTWHITHHFDIAGGLRYSSNRQRFQQIGSGLLVGSVPASRTSDDVFTYLANARYRFNDRATIYLRYATGYRPGGPNFVVTDAAGLPLDLPTFKSDSLQSYEGGFRFQARDRSFSADLGGYHIDWKDIQVATAAGGVSVIANAGRARIDGAELTLTARPIPSFTATGAFAYQDARLVDAVPELGAFAGERVPNVPHFTAALSVDYRTPGSNGLRPSAGATLRIVSDRYASFDGNAGIPQYYLPDYASVDLRLGFSLGPVDAQAFVHNLFDKRGQISAATVLAAAGGPAQVTMLQPRTIGLSASMRF